MSGVCANAVVAKTSVSGFAPFSTPGVEMGSIQELAFGKRSANSNVTFVVVVPTGNVYEKDG